MKINGGLKLLLTVYACSLLFFLAACGGGGGGGVATTYTQADLEGIWVTYLELGDDTSYALYDRYYYFDETGELVNAEGALGETIYDFSGNIAVDNGNITGTTWLDHQENAAVQRHSHDLIFDGRFVNVNEIDADWYVPDAGSGTAKWYRVPYTGITDQATLTAENASLIAVNTWISGQTGGSVGILGAVQETGGNYGPAIRFILEDVAMRISFEELFPAPLVGTVQQVSETLYGSCGGSALVTGTGDDQTGEVQGTVVFSSYCEDSAILSGTADLFGYVDISDELIFYVFNFRGLTVQASGRSVTLDGTMSADFGIYPPKELLSYVVTDNSLAKSYWMKDLILEIAMGADYFEITDSTGRYYDPDYGYVDLAVEQTIRINDTDMWPSSGKIVMIGAPGTQGGNTKTRLTFVSATEYLVEADTDGDGAYDDYSSGPQLWSAL